MVPAITGKTASKTPTEGGLASRYAQLVPTKALGSTEIQPAKAKPAAEIVIYTEQQTSEALARYQHYLTAGIDSKHVTTFQEDWAVNAVSMLPHHERCSLSHTPGNNYVYYTMSVSMYTTCAEAVMMHAAGWLTKHISIHAVLPQADLLHNPVCVSLHDTCLTSSSPRSSAAWIWNALLKVGTSWKALDVQPS